MTPNETYQFAVPVEEIDLYRVVCETGLDRDDGPRAVEVTIDGKAYTLWNQYRIGRHPDLVNDFGEVRYLDLYPDPAKHVLRLDDGEIRVWSLNYGGIRLAVGRHARALLDSVVVTVEAFA